MRWLLLLVVQGSALRLPEASGIVRGSTVQLQALEQSVEVTSTSAVHEEEETCSSCVGLLDYPRLLQGTRHRWCASAALLLWAAALIWLLNTTAQDFFVPPLVYWSRLLQLRPELAGATLVALGNGAPDVFAVATAASSKDLPLALAELLGANMCVLCVAGGAVVLASHWAQAREAGEASAGIAKPKEGRLRLESAVGYGLALAYMLSLMRDGGATTFQAACMPLLYVVYLAAVMRKGGGIDAETECGDPGASPSCDADGAPLPAGLAWPEGSSTSAVAAWALAWPTYAVRWVLIPPADLQWDRLRRLISSASPVGLAVFCGLTSGLSWESLVALPQLVIFAGSMVLGCVVFCFSDDGPAVPHFYPLLTLLSKVSSILVLSSIAGEITALVETLGMVNGVPRLWLGSTVIAWGNSLGDLVTGVAMVRHGQSRTAFASILAGPLFNCLVGAGLALTLAARRSGGRVVLWGSLAGKASLLTNVGFLIVAWLMLTAMLMLRQRSSLRWSMSLLLLYGAFMVCILVVERLDLRGDFLPSPRPVAAVAATAWG